MRAMVLQQPRTPLRDTALPDPMPAANQMLVRVAACGVCRTDLHVVDGELTEPKLPIIPGHEIVGHVEALAGRTAIQTHVVPFALSDANTALEQLRSGALTGAAVLVPDSAGR